MQAWFVFFYECLNPLTYTLFPYTTLFRSDLARDHAATDDALAPVPHHRLTRRDRSLRLVEHDLGERSRRGDRKSTRLNSSHGYSSYAVICLKKKTRRSTCGTWSWSATPPA